MECGLDERRKTVEKSKTPGDRKANEWALEFWDKRALKPGRWRSLSQNMALIRTLYKSGFVLSFFDWPGGGGNLNYPKVYNDGLAV